MSWTEEEEHHAADIDQLADVGKGEGIDPQAVPGCTPDAGVDAARGADQRIMEELAVQEDDGGSEGQNARDVEKLRILFVALAMIEARAWSEKQRWLRKLCLLTIGNGTDAR